MISPNATIEVKNGRIAIVPDTILKGGSQRKANPAPKQSLPSSSSIISHTSVMSFLEVDKSSWAFVAKRYRANLKSINNWNMTGALNA